MPAPPRAPRNVSPADDGDRLPRACPRCEGTLQEPDPEEPLFGTCEWCGFVFCEYCLADWQVICVHGTGYHDQHCRFRTAAPWAFEYLGDGRPHARFPKCTACLRSGNPCKPPELARHDEAKRVDRDDRALQEFEHQTTWAAWNESILPVRPDDCGGLSTITGMYAEYAGPGPRARSFLGSSRLSSSSSSRLIPREFVARHATNPEEESAARRPRVIPRFSEAPQAPRHLRRARSPSRDSEPATPTTAESREESLARLTRRTGAGRRPPLPPAAPAGDGALAEVARTPIRKVRLALNGTALRPEDGLLSKDGEFMTRDKLIQQGLSRSTFGGA